jgi:hypothetical protein
MGRITAIFLFAICISTHGVFAAIDTTLNLQEANFIEGSYSDFYIDNLNNLYLLNKDNQLKKINDKGDSVAVSNALRKYGDIYSMDVSNPLKILVYYKDFGTIVILDRFLSNINTIDLRKYGILQSQAVAQSYDNNYWVFDEVENKLKKVDDNGNILLSTPDFRTIFDKPFTPGKIIDYNGFVYLYDKKFGWMIFDYYGAFKQKVELPGWNYVQVVKNNIYGFDSSHIYVYNTQTFTSTLYDLGPKLAGVLKLQREINMLYVLKADGLYIYSIHP